MINIAVMLSGHPKYLDITQHLFKHWDSLYENVKFDFFLSLWESIDNDIIYEQGESCGRFEGVLDYGKLDWVTKWETLKEKDCPYDLKSHSRNRHQPHYMYGLSRVNKLRNSYDKTYDAVFQTRGDLIFSKMLLDELVNCLTRKRGGLIAKLDKDGNYTGKSQPDERPNPMLSSRNIKSISGTDLHNTIGPNGNIVSQEFWTSDSWFYGVPEVMDKFSDMFDYFYVKKQKLPGGIMLHISQAEYLHKIGIYNSPLESYGGTCSIIREPIRFTFNSDGGGYGLGAPSPDQLKRFLGEKGSRWIYDGENSNERWNESAAYFRNTEK